MIPKSIELKDLNAELNKISRKLIDNVSQISDAVTQNLALGANEIRNTIIKSMRDTPKSGRHYRRGKGGKVHIASSPGNPPAIDYGELVRSIAFDVRDWEVEVGSAGGAPYSVFLEGGANQDLSNIFGGSFNPFSAGGEKMAPRPFLGPAVLKHKDEIIKNVGDAAFEVIKKGFE